MDPVICDRQSVNNKRDKAERRSNRAQHVGRLIDRVIAKPLRRNGFAHSEVLTRWSAIVGTELAAVSCPEKLNFTPHNQGTGVLSIRVASAAALEFQHRQPEIIERVNSYFGFRAVKRLRLVQAPLPTFAHQKAIEPARTVAPKPLTPSSQTRAVENDDLRAALDRLEQRIAGSRAD